jgi:L-asparagine transporter-like permease
MMLRLATTIANHRAHVARERSPQPAKAMTTPQIRVIHPHVRRSIGVETASVAAGKVRDPDRSVGRATILGTLATAVVYVLSLVAVFGILPSSTLATSNAPFSDAPTRCSGAGLPAT